MKNKDFELIKSDILKVPFGFGVNNQAMVSTEETMKDGLKKLGIMEESVSIWGAGEVYREFMHVDDLADASLFLMNNCGHKDVGEVVNIGTGMDIKIKDLAALISEIIGYTGKIKHDITKPDGTPKKLLDVSRVKDLGWIAQIGLTEGIKKVYSWYCSTN